MALKSTDRDAELAWLFEPAGGAVAAVADLVVLFAVLDIRERHTASSKPSGNTRRNY